MLDFVFSLVGRKLLIDMGCLHRELGTCQFSSISGLLNGGILLRVVCLFKFVSQTVSPVRPWKARSPTLSNTRHRDPFDLKSEGKLRTLLMTHCADTQIAFSCVSCIKKT